MRFLNRKDAGEKLAQLLYHYKKRNCLVYALPRGGVIVGHEIAQKLKTRLEIIMIKKIGHPDNPEYALGAVSATGQTIFNEDHIRAFDKRWIKKEISEKQIQAQNQKNLYMSGVKTLPPRETIAIIVDDGIATGLTMRCGIRELMKYNPKKIIVAVPVSTPEFAKECETSQIELTAVTIPYIFHGSVSSYYQNFPQVSDDEVRSIMKIYYYQDGIKCDIAY